MGRVGRLAASAGREVAAGAAVSDARDKVDWKLELVVLQGLR